MKKGSQGEAHRAPGIIEFPGLPKDPPKGAKWKPKGCPWGLGGSEKGPQRGPKGDYMILNQTQKQKKIS